MSDKKELKGSLEEAPVKIEEEDLHKLKEIQDTVDNLNKHRQELGRLHQVMANMVQVTNDIEQDLASKRRALTEKYGLEKYGSSQWAIDFEEGEFVKLEKGSPVIP